MPKKKRFPTSELRIPITQEIINNAIPKDSGHCVIADSIRAFLPEVTRVTVDLQTIRFTLPDGERVVYLTPAHEQKLLTDFDQEILPAPRMMYLRRPIQRVPYRPQDAKNRETHTEPRKVKTKQHGRGLDVLVEGGRLPPRAALSNAKGRRRSFGLRQLKP